MSCLVSCLQESLSWLVWKPRELTYWQGQYQWDLVRLCRGVCLSVSLCVSVRVTWCLCDTWLVVCSLWKKRKMMMAEGVRRLPGQNFKEIVHIYIVCMLLFHLNVWNDTFPIFFWKWQHLFLKTQFFGHCEFCTEPLGSHPKGCGYWCLPYTKQQRQ